MKPAGPWVAFLRAVNVGGRFIKMEALARHFGSLGCRQVRTFINSGNVLFEHADVSPEALAQQLQSGLAPLMGFEADVFLRRLPALQALVQQAQGCKAQVPQGEVNIGFLHQPLTPAQAASLQGLSTARDSFLSLGPQVLWLTQGKQSESAISNAVLERKLGVRSTLRRLSMLERLLAQEASTG